ncbi:putative Gluconate 5-dehydrogenase [Blattamonas nauphoetae]|uniref:Gluconate 5-dehydrogenase n=1 Tax=Blattamonas nauphoetae TaxID=2049346 RepID=A0ABQ9XHW0_9EUKA|nr:putative Gluconate 5-dehydrogenase [Blattamonas nauphoetae]
MQPPPDLFNIAGRVAIVTGASSGLGEQFAKYLAAYGCTVVLVARRLKRLEQVAQTIIENKGTAFVQQCDVSVFEMVEATVKTVKEKFGRIDILVNNHGLANSEPAEDQQLENWHKIIDVDLHGTYYFAREVGKVMIEQKYGKIVNIASLHNNVVIHPSVQKISAYASAKGGVQMLTKSLAAEWAQHGITVNAICPAYFQSEATADTISSPAFLQFVETRCPIGRIGRDGELNGALHYFVSDASSYTTGQLLYVDGGWSCI